MAKELNSYDLSRSWFDFCFANPELVNPAHTAIYFFAIEHCNRLGWKEKFGFPTQMTMDALGIKKHQTYIKYFNDLCEWGFITMVQKSTNQYSANIISLQNALPKNGKALDKAFITHAAKHLTKHGSPTGQSTGQSKDSIDKQETNNQEQGTSEQESAREVRNFEWFKNQIDEIWADGLPGDKKNKLGPAIENAWAFLSAEPSRLKIIDAAGCKKLVNNAFGFIKNEKNGTGKKQQHTATLAASVVEHYNLAGSK